MSPRSESEHAQICNQLQLESGEDQRIMTLDTSSICYTCHGVSQLLCKDNLIIFLHFHILYLNEWHLHRTSSKLEMSTSVTTFSSSLFVVNHLQNMVDLASSFESTTSFLSPQLLTFIISFLNFKHTHTHTHTKKCVLAFSFFLCQTNFGHISYTSIQFSQELVPNFSTLCTPTIFYGSLGQNVTQDFK